MARPTPAKHPTRPGPSRSRPRTEVTTHSSGRAPTRTSESSHLQIPPPAAQRRASLAVVVDGVETQGRQPGELPPCRLLLLTTTFDTPALPSPRFMPTALPSNPSGSRALTAYSTGMEDQGHKASPEYRLKYVHTRKMKNISMTEQAVCMHHGRDNIRQRSCKKT